MENFESRIQDEFHTLFFAVKGPKDMALFTTKLSKMGNVELYISPGSLPIAQGLITKYSGAPCEKPDSEVAILLVGHQSEIHKLLA